MQAVVDSREIIVLAEEGADNSRIVIPMRL